MNMKKVATQQENFEFYQFNKIELSQKYINKKIVIYNKDIVGTFDTAGDAYNFGVEKFGLGNFIIQDSNYFDSIQYLSRLAFA